MTEGWWWWGGGGGLGQDHATRTGSLAGKESQASSPTSLLSASCYLRTSVTPQATCVTCCILEVDVRTKLTHIHSHPRPSTLLKTKLPLMRACSSSLYCEPFSAGRGPRQGATVLPLLCSLHAAHIPGLIILPCYIHVRGYSWITRQFPDHTTDSEYHGRFRITQQLNSESQTLVYQQRWTVGLLLISIAQTGWYTIITLSMPLGADKHLLKCDLHVL